MTYKPELDGLRAIAVLLVLLTHMELLLPGGFIGVDVFFVISGYLITGIIFREMSEKRFSFINFYGRRFARLYPALIVAIALTFIAGYLITDPVYFKNLARTARYAITSTANVYYNTHMGYFAVAAKSQPFLHTWSLGVEWQFYLIWPLIMWGILKVTPKTWIVVLTLLLITVSSLIGSEWATTHSSNAAYYQMHFRAFELGIGGLLVFLYPHINLKPLPSAVMTGAGLLLMLYLAMHYSEHTPFPGLSAFCVCIAAAFCMLGGKGFAKGNILRFKSVVFVGQASYSIYLVHWPLVVLTRYLYAADLVLSQKLILFALSIVLGILLYLLIEKRINWRKIQNKLKGCSVMGGMTLAFVALFIYVDKQAEGLPYRTPNQELMKKEFLTWGGMQYLLEQKLGDPDGKPIAVLTGDSFAGSTAKGVDDFLKGSGYSIHLIFAPGCTISQIDESKNIQPACTYASNRSIEVANQEDLPLIMVQSWGSGVILAQRGITIISKYSTPESYREFTIRNLDDIHAKIHGKPLFLVSSVPYRRWGSSDLECLTRPALSIPACINEVQPYPYQETPINPYNELLEEYAQNHTQVFYIESAKGACPDGICTADRNARLYSDGFHTSEYGSVEVNKYVIQDILDILEKLPKNDLPSQNNLNTPAADDL